MEQEEEDKFDFYSVVDYAKFYSKKIGIIGIKNYETQSFFQTIILDGFNAFINSNLLASSVNFSLYYKFPTYFLDEEDDNYIDLLNDIFPVEYHLLEDLKIFDTDTTAPISFYYELNNKVFFSNNISLLDYYVENKYNKYNYIKIKITSNIDFVENLTFTATGYYINLNYFRRPSSTHAFFSHDI